ncbi:MAG: outer membrane beta-barrel protein [candidate division Zixibacteria bacterium]|nr:outer membrane beta-barrel protein [candidate division Zixibacteria bacterium]
MRRVIFFLCFVALIPSVHGRELKSKFMLTLKAGPAYPHLEHTNRVTFFGSQIDYFVSDQVSIGLDLKYLEYYEIIYYAVPRYLGAPDDYRNKWDWYSLGVSGKFLSGSKGPSPFIKLGAGFYIPQVHHPITRWLQDGSLAYKDKETGEISPGFNVGAGLQYIVWKRFSLQIEGSIDYIFNKSKNLNTTESFTFGNLTAGISLIL